MQPERRPGPRAGGLAASDAADRAARLDARLTGANAPEILETALSGEMGRVALVTSFGAESAVLLHMLAGIDRGAPVLFVDTGRLFAETLAYQRQLAGHLGLRDLRVLRPEPADLATRDPHGALRFSDADACCALRKTAPLARGLRGFDGWITGRKRFQSSGRAALGHVEADPATGRLKVNPLARWQPRDLAAYMRRHDLPPHPLVARGYPSIGCAPCTSPAAEGEDPRAGRWRGESKTECGIHLDTGRVVRLRPTA